MTKRDNVNVGPTDLVEALLAEDLSKKYGPMVGGTHLAKVLGFNNPAGLRQALKRGLIPIPLLELPRRKGRFALTRDIAAWIASCRRATMVASEKSESHEASKEGIPM